MKQSIKQQVLIRVALIFIVVIVSGIVTLSGMKRVRLSSKSTEQATQIHALVLTAEKAHYGWVENLCSAVALGTEFTGSTDYKTCVLGSWIYGPELEEVEDQRIHQLVREMQPIHQAIHESAVEDPVREQDGSPGGPPHVSGEPEPMWISWWPFWSRWEPLRRNR